MRPLSRALATACLVACLACTSAPSAGAAPASGTTGTGPPLRSWTPAFLASVSAPDAAPIGTNDWSCRPSAAHPYPVILIHGTWENALSTWSGMAPWLKRDGHCVYAIDFGKSNPLEQGGPLTITPGAYGARPIERSAKEVAAFVRQVLAHTGARKADLVGHSQGGLLIRQMLRFEGLAGSTDKVVTIAATNHGTTMDGLGALDRILRDRLGMDLDPVLNHVVGVSGVQQIYDSPLLRTLAAGGDTEPGISYTVLATRYDEVSTPYDRTFLTAGPGATVDNVTIQDGCPQDLSEHLSVDYSPRAIDWVRRALDHARMPLASIRCTATVPFFGDSEAR
ncbi:alpha/beta fold hydrolase [Tsukamurella sp. 8F]|uniref:esterase/lipase family protein n=1 Tax=unclassified Tsukamurella TaxID=2633480 RepID=UPI0023B967CF|nr:MULTISPECIES: alpha/beta fold hydrolase [unclassified Tsukamurella]MDF0529117.1 alpha/beta fold hydrolase [Tsukamurella sp. 8J]MDF0588133.1 alpha/beta fold hydrolase [Tsukamurella sp. 8F]